MVRNPQPITLYVATARSPSSSTMEQVSKQHDPSEESHTLPSLHVGFQDEMLKTDHDDPLVLDVL